MIKTLKKTFTFTLIIILIFSKNNIANVASPAHLYENKNYDGFTGFVTIVSPMYKNASKKMQQKLIPKSPDSSYINAPITISKTFKEPRIKKLNTNQSFTEISNVISIQTKNYIQTKPKRIQRFDLNN